MSVACVDDFKHILQPNTELMSLIITWRDSEEVSVLKHVLMLGGVGDVDRGWRESREEKIKCHIQLRFNSITDLIKHNSCR